MEGTVPLGRCQYPSGAMWDTMYGGMPYDTLGGMGDDSWLERLRRRLFGADSGRVERDDQNGRIRPGRPEDTIPMYRVPDVPDPDRRPPAATPPGRQQADDDRPLGERVPPADDEDDEEEPEEEEDDDD